MTVVFVLGAVGVWLAPAQGTLAYIASTFPVYLAFLGLVMLIVLRLATGREAMARVWLSFGNWRNWLVFGVGIALFYTLQAVLNALSGLGSSQIGLLPAASGFSREAFLVLAGVQAVLLAPFLAILIAFGEEYGWRGYLQTELFKLGRVRGVILLGIIWGVWHWPIILMGYNYPGHPLLGLLLMTIYTTGLAVVFGYAVLRSGSVLLAAYLHALNNQVAAYIVAIGFSPYDTVFSFGIGI